MSSLSSKLGSGGSDSGGSGSDEERRFSIHLNQREDYLFEVDFDLASCEPMLVDEPPPLGEGVGPNPARLVALGAAHCLCASLNFCLSKARSSEAQIGAAVMGVIRRNAKGRLRLARIEVAIEVQGLAAEDKRLKRCLALFEDFCVVSSALREGIEVDVSVEAL